MPTDQELLEGAAKAAGGLLYVEDMHGWGGVCEWIHVDSDGNRGAWWHPLTDDGDALRLAVRLAISIDKAKNDYFASGGDFSDPYAFTRQAIVRAAYEIGKAT